MTLSEIKANVAAALEADPQASHVAGAALDEIQAALIRLQALGHHFVLVARSAEDHVAVEWPKWDDGKLWADQAEWDAGHGSAKAANQTMGADHATAGSKPKKL